jgi:hypothetical protein
MKNIIRKNKTLKFIIPVFLLFLMFYSCRDAVVINQNTPSYNEVVNVNFNDVNIKVYVKDEDSLTTGYNEMFMKVNKSGSELSTGFVKLFPKMWMTPTYLHSTAVKDKFEFDNASGYYKGYCIFNMPTSPPDVVWYGVFTYVDENNNSVTSDSTAMYTAFHRDKQWSFFFDSTDQSTYMFSIVSPLKAVKGMNELSLYLHKTDAKLMQHEQINDALMSICVYNFYTGQKSTGNISPVGSPDGIYRGKFNISDTGVWKICDTINYMGRNITNNPPPMPEFYFEVR